MVKRVFTDYIQDIFDSINDIESFIKGMSFDIFLKAKKHRANFHITRILKQIFNLRNGVKYIH